MEIIFIGPSRRQGKALPVAKDYSFKDGERSGIVSVTKQAEGELNLKRPGARLENYIELFLKDMIQKEALPASGEVEFNVDQME